MEYESKGKTSQSLHAGVDSPRLVSPRARSFALEPRGAAQGKEELEKLETHKSFTREGKLPSAGS